MDFLKRAKKEVTLSKDEIAEMLKVSPQALDAFEQKYKEASVIYDETSDNLFDKNAKMAAEEKHLGENENVADEPDTSDLEDRIVDELLYPRRQEEKDEHPAVTLNEINSLPEAFRPQLTGTMYKRDLAGEPSCEALLWFLKQSMEEKNPKKKQAFYHHFRQGLDILDLDPITYEIIGMNKNSIGHWFYEISAAAKEEGFFLIPKTKIVKVPLPILQLTRLDYGSLTPATLRIVDKWAEKAFDLDPTKTYFIKTGTYSSKFDFRNAKISSPKEVREIGEYLLFIHFQALMMASPLNQPYCIYGVSTTNEWVVREYIEDKENNPCIYHGMPLHTEYRAFVDFNTDEVLGITPYWDPETMKRRFSKGPDAETPDMKHDYIIYKMYEDILMDRYNKNRELVLEHLRQLVPNVDLNGQWSVDIMQNGEDFYIIDMALAEASAFYKECVPEKLRRVSGENWIPQIE